MWNTLGTILLWIFAIIGVVASLLWVYAWFIIPPKKVEKEKNKRKTGIKRKKNK